MRISSLELHNIGVFEHEVIDFRKQENPNLAEIHILTGQNGTGKSTILYALASAISWGAIHKRFRFVDERSSVKIRFDDQSEVVVTPSIETVSVPLMGGTAKPKKSVLKYTSQSQTIETYQGYLRSYIKTFQNVQLDFAVFAYSGSRSLSSANILAIQEVSKGPLENSLNFFSPVDSQILLQWIANTKAKAAFALQEGKQQLAEQYHASLARIEDAVKHIIGNDV